MATQGGLKHVATEPSHLDKKRTVRRRGVGPGVGVGAVSATSRTAALRRAPSDSDCSGETASLSADSNERLRPAPPPPRANKTRSRRRGSEWEVLEGLKDGQRFERRPEVFNGYLHKKRKWPLKGWHKRFFVIDGGILVYARSPGDVSRGRLHGSVDVGLSVISAKARRRRIDIDADEFIYHLRAKTPDVFRTWLNVLKVHRLYRQHLLTFGARESAPKIHPPLDELPPTENTSRVSSSSFQTYSTEGSRLLKIEKKQVQQDESYAINTINGKNCNQTSNLPKENLVHDWKFFENTDFDSDLIPLNFEPIEEEIAVIKPEAHTHSMCSMKCMARLYEKDLEELKNSPNDSTRATETEKQVDIAELDRNSLKTNDPFVNSSVFAYSFNSVDCDREINRVINNNISKTPPFPERNEPYRIPESSQIESVFFKKKAEPTTTLFLFARKKHRRPPKSSEHNMKRSRKSTNLVKYRNVTDEPCLKVPPSNCILQKRNRIRLSDHMVEIDKKINAEVQVAVINEDKSSQDVMSASEYDELAAKLVTKIFNERSVLRQNANRIYDVQYYVHQMVKELYDVKINQAQTHPVKVLFKSLLEFWLKNTKEVSISCAVKRVKSIDVQSSEYFTKDQNLSGIIVERATKDTQYYAYEAGLAFETKMIDKKRQGGPMRPATNSFIKERRIQELERILKSTVYTCDTVCGGGRSVEKDIAITKKLIDNLDSMQKCDVPTSNEETQDNSNPSSEFPVIQQTFNNFSKETAIPTDIMKEFLGAYLEVLINNSSSPDDNTTSTNDTKTSTESPKCDVESESVQNKLSKGISTNNSKEIANGQDSEQKCLKDLLEKVTKMFSKFSKSDYNKNNIDKQVQPDDTKVEGSFKADIVRNELPDKNIISENKDENSIVIDLTKFDLERISLLSDPTLKGMMSISIKLKERPPNIGESRHKKLNLKFSENTSNRIENQELILTSDSSGKTYQNNNFDTRISFKNPYTDYNPNIPKDDIGLRPYISSSDATSKAYRRIYESDHSLDVSMKNTSIYDSFHESKKAFDYHDDVQSCYILSSVKKSGMFSSSQIKKKVRVKESNEPIIGPSEQTSKEYAPKVIDEKFILLLLENLTLLSQNIPEIHKEINSLYEKLKKKHGKDLKYTQKSLGLLGKIYQRHKENESNAATNYDVSMKEDKPIKITSSNAENGINTSENLFGLKNLVDRSTSVYLVVTEVKEFEMQTDREPRKRQRKSVSFVDENTSVCTDDLRNVENCHCLNVTAETDKKDVACCTPNWYKESGVGTTIKYLMNNEGSCQNFRIIPQSKAKFKYNVPNVRYVLNADKGKDDEKPTEEEIEKKLWANIRRDPVRDIHTDPDKRLNFFLKDKVVKRDFNVYQLFVSNKFQATLSSSMSSSNLELLKSDCSELKTIYRCTSDPSFCSESGGSLENASRELGQAQLSVQQLQRLLEALELQQHHHDTDVFDKVSLEGASPSVKKDRRKFGLRKKKSSSKCASVELAPGTHHHVDGSTSHMALSALTAPPSPGGGASSMPNSAASLPIACAATRPQSLPGPNTENLMAGPASLSSLTPDHQLREDFTVLAKDLVNTLKGVVNTLVCERGRLRAAMDSAEGGAAGGGGPMLAALRTNLNSALQQNSELRSRLSRIHDASDLADISSVNNTDPAIRQFQQSLSYSSSCLSASEFFDAEEHDDQPQDILPNDEAGVIELDGDSSSEAGSLSSEEGSASSDNSDGAPSAEPITVRLKNGVSGSGSGSGEGGGSETGWSRRTRLPCPRPTPGGPSLWNLLYKNIGKDLSQISMPVTINEPLNMLQRLCEELEYSELLDMAANATGEMDRMSLVAAFAVSSYAASAHRAASKPFNPLLAETYECVRPDKGFRFLAEQVSHHPPVSACHAESARWSLWQEARIKTKFWGKSMEFQPAGRVHLRLLPQGDHYEWNKVTTCVHNLFGGQRWVDQYGDMIITCHGTDVTAKLNFIKASSWSSGRHEVRGAVYGSDGARLRLHGRWSEALYAGDPPSAKCLWRPGAMPPEHELYYGFTRFAMELNEIEPGMRDVLPHTDTRLRPDQRALEEGDVDTAERLKHQLEQAQRDRRRHSPEHTPCWFRKSMEGGEEVWVFTGEYWRARDAGFSSRSQTSPPPAIW